MNEFSGQIVKAIREKQDVQKARWLENYVKHDIQSFGVGIPEIREIIKDFEKHKRLSESSIEFQTEFLNDLMAHAYTEPKLAAVLFVQLYWQTKHAGEILTITSGWFNNEWIRDWNVCDWLCVRLLSPVLDKDPLMAVEEFSGWNKSPDLWKARASLVPFAQSKTISNHQVTILQFSTELIKRPERFCKTAVGWVLREYSKTDPAFVKDFLEQFKAWTTKEVISNATKYIGV